MKKQLIPIICIFHFYAIFCWSAPINFGVSGFLNAYINATASQQYWDFFAPHSISQHQYLTLCETMLAAPGQETITCNGRPLFTNLPTHFNSSQRIDFAASRLYRLTENLIKLENQSLFQAFTDYYRKRPQGGGAVSNTAQLIAHQFELHPEINNFPKAGYHWDTVLMATQ